MSNLVWSQSKGEGSIEGVVVAHGYAGRGEGKNNPEMQKVVATGPLPRGLYRLAAPHDDANTGPFSMRLTPFGPPAEWPAAPSNVDLELREWMFGRADFLIHPDSVAHPGEASHGCIVPTHGANGETGRATRELIAARCKFAEVVR